MDSIFTLAELISWSSSRRSCPKRIDIKSEMGVDLNSNCRRRHLLVSPIKGRASSLCSILLLLHAESEIASLCGEIGLSLWCGNWTSDSVNATRFDFWRRCVSITKPSYQILQRLQKRIIKGEALYFSAWHCELVV